MPTQTHREMCIAVLFIIAKKWKQPKCTATEEQMNNEWYIHMVKYYSVIKTSEAWLHGVTWMNLKTLNNIKEVRHT